VRLEVTNGSERWSRTVAAASPLAADVTVDLRFESVPLVAGLSRLEARADADSRVPEVDENNNLRWIPRDPQLACGAPDPSPAPGTEIAVTVTRAGTAAAPLARATIEVASALGAGPVVATATSADDGRAALHIPADSRSPVLRLEARAPGCAPSTRVVTLPGVAAAPAPPLEVAIDLVCEESAAGVPGAPNAGGARRLEIEAALPGRLQLDEGAPTSMTFGTKVVVEPPGAKVRVRATSLTGVLFFDRTLDLDGDSATTLTIDAPVLRAEARDARVVEDLRSGLEWAVGATAADSQAAAAATCDRLVRGGASDWRLPDIDQLAFVLEARARLGDRALLPELSTCCVWSSTEHAGLRLTFYVEGGHIYGRRSEEAGVGALCVRGTPYTQDPLFVPDRYHDRLPGARRFRPRD
jgi:hypothetical protein